MIGIGRLSDTQPLIHIFFQNMFHNTIIFSARLLFFKTQLETELSFFNCNQKIKKGINDTPFK